MPLKLLRRGVALLLILLSTALAAAEPTGCPWNYANGQAPHIINPKLAQKTQPLCFSDIGIMHSGISRTPLWAAEHLTRDRLQKAYQVRRVDQFHAEPSLPVNERAELSDYARSGFDRGHLVPAADMPTRESQHDSFSLANMVPQNHKNNTVLWEHLEAATRGLTQERGDLFVISGPLFLNTSVQKLKGRVLMPSHLFKVIYDPGLPGMAAYLVENSPSDDYKVMSVAELEAIAGIDLFPGVPSNLKQHAMPLPNPQSHRSARRAHTAPGSL